MNDIVDNVAKRALIAGYASDEYISSKFPFEQLSVTLSDEKVTGSLRKAFERFWGATVARQFFHDKHIVNKSNFNLIWWEGMAKVMDGFPKLYRLWVTKHVSEFCGTNKQMWYWDNNNDPKCPCCGREEEHTMHITRCRSPGRLAMLRLSVRSITGWMASSGADPILVEMIESYLLAQDSKTMLECVPYPDADLEIVARSQDRLGWDCFVEGRISKVFLEHMKPVLLEYGTYLSPERWGRTFIELLLQLTHKQWLFRNSRKHFRRLDGLTESEHLKIFEDMQDLMFTDPHDLLPRHQHLMEIDFGSLSEGSSIPRLHWIASVESAIQAADCVRRGHFIPGSLGRFMTPKRMRVLPRRSSNGSIVYRRTTRRKGG